MKKFAKHLIFSLALIGTILMIAYGCKKDDSSSSSKKDPVITWSNPADVIAGTSLTAAQLNATADVAGTFVYTPAIGTVLNVGQNQDLKTDFTPADAASYNNISKTVKINVTVPTGSGIIFNPNLTYGTMTDQEGNVYKTITIGTQTWMAENLRTTKYRNGDPVPNVPDSATWHNLTTGAYCNYYNDAGNVATYGRIYNWYTVSDPRKITPAGWHVPTIDEWHALYDFLGGDSVAGGKLKETGTTHWQSPNAGATNETGFTALPGGMRPFVPGWRDFIGIGYEGFWWSSTETVYEILNTQIYSIYSGVSWGGSDKNRGHSIRCIRD